MTQRSPHRAEQDAIDDDYEELPPLRRSIRAPGDSASRLGFVIGSGDGDIKFNAFWTWHVFRIPYPMIVGRLEAPIYLPGRLDDAEGNLRLKTELHFVDTGRTACQFDEIRLEPGDYVAIFHVGGGAAAGGQGSYPTANVGTFDIDMPLPERPLIDELIRNRSGFKVAVPQWRWFARLTAPTRVRKGR